MVIELSLLKNDVKEKLSIVILCAGMGTRLKKITETIPKPLIKIEKLKNISILHHIINNLINLEIKHIGIIIGHLGNTIRKNILTLKTTNQAVQDKVIIIDSENQYKLGPLYSFLSICKKKDFFTSKNHYLLIPGDTIFDDSILKEVISIISNNSELITKYPFVFYRSIGLKLLKQLYNLNRIISYVEIDSLGSEIILKKISQLRIREILSKNVLNQIIPIISLSYDSINEILIMNRKNLYKTVWEALNQMIFNGKKILAFEIKNKYNFYDIDYASDIKNVKKKKRKGQ